MESLRSEMILTLSLSLSLGGLLMIGARLLRMPAIVALLGGGFVLGGEGLGLVQAESLGPILPVLVSLAVGLILFEGGLTLDLDGYQSANRIIKRLLTAGVLATWLGTALAIAGLFGFSAADSLLCASLVIVTGPTVIQPLLKRIRLQRNLHHILHWEGVLIDAVGVFIAVLCFEMIALHEGGMALANFALRIGVGLGLGWLGGRLICLVLRLHLVPEDMINVLTVAGAILIFGASEAIFSESGLLSVTVAGLVIGSRKPPELKAIREFKGVITDLLIGFLFILLVSRLRLDQFQAFGSTGLLLVATIVLVVRPLTILAGTLGEKLSWRETIFLCWVGPRGVVAASMASLFALTLAERQHFAVAEFVEPFVYSVIVTTVVLQGFTAGPLAWLLRLQQEHPSGWLLVGAHPFAISLAEHIRAKTQVPVVLLDLNRKAVQQARRRGLPAVLGDAREMETLSTLPELQGVGRLLALTDNEDLNELLCARWSELYGRPRVFRWAAKPSTENSRRHAGRVVWPWLPRPSVVSAELISGETVIESSHVPPAGSDWRILCHSVGLTTHLDMAYPTKPSARLTALWLRRQKHYLLSALDPDLVICGVSACDKVEILRLLTEKCVAKHPRLKVEEVLQEILEMEDAWPTSIGHGVSIPHAHLAQLETPVCAVAQCRPPGVACDNEPIRLLFFLLTPQSDNEIHLSILGEIARLMAEEETRKFLGQAETNEELYRVLCREFQARMLQGETMAEG